MENKLLVVWKINWKLEDLLKVKIILVFFATKYHKWTVWRDFRSDADRNSTIMVISYFRWAIL